MKNFLVRMLLAPAFTVAALALASSAQAQQADEDPAPATPRQQQPTAAPTSPQPQEVRAPSSNDAQTQQSQAAYSTAQPPFSRAERNFLVTEFTVLCFNTPVSLIRYSLFGFFR